MSLIHIRFATFFFSVIGLALPAKAQDLKLNAGERSSAWKVVGQATGLSFPFEEDVDDGVAAPDRSPIFQALAAQLTGELPSSALEFDGRTQYVSVPSIRYDGSHPITLEAFLTPDQLRNCAIGDTQLAGIALSFARQTYSIVAHNGTSYDRATADGIASRRVRVHMAGTFDGATMQVFVNGKLEKTGKLNGTFRGSGFPMTIGASPSTFETGIDHPFDGIIDQVRISKRVRYTKEFEVPTALEADENTLALFRCDEGQGQTLADSSGKKNHGEVRGAKWVTDAAIRHRAALGLAEFGRHAVPVLTKALAAENADVQLEAIEALGIIGRDARPAVLALKSLDDDDDQRVRGAANQAITLIETQAVLDAIRTTPME